VAANPYAAPAVDDAPPEPDPPARFIPAGVTWIARGHLLLVAIGLAVAGITAIAMRVEAWTPEASGAGDAYARTFALHGAAMMFMVVAPVVFGVLANLTVYEAMAVTRARTLGVAALALLLWASGAVAAVVITLATDPYAFYQPEHDFTGLRIAVAAMTAGMILNAAQLAVIAATGMRRASNLARIVAVVLLLATFWPCITLVLAIAEQLRVPSPSFQQATLDAFASNLHAELIAALAVFTWLRNREPDARPGVGAGIALLAVCAWYLLPLQWLPGLPDLAGRLGLVAVWLGFVARGWSWRSPASWLLALGLAPALLILAVVRLVTHLLQTDIHLHDTLFEVGAFHLPAVVVVLTALAGAFAWAGPLLGARVRRGVASVAAVSIAIGMVGHASALLLLGARGMPRRYYAYPPEFLDLQQLASLAAFAVVLGAALLLASFARARE
jgi:cytochrome c oxidase subunit I